MTDQASGLRRLMGEQGEKSTRVITITSGKGGVGKSSIALNLAIALSRRGQRVLIFDTDFGLSNINVMLGVSTRYDLLDVIKRDMDICDVIEQGLEGVQFISGGSGVYELTQLGGEELMRIMNNLKALQDVADVILLDTGAGISDNILRMIYASHETLVVTTPEPTAVVDAYALVKIVSERGSGAQLSLIVNKAGSAAEAESVMDCLVRIAEKNVDTRLGKLGFVERDENMQKAIRTQVPILVSYPNSPASVNIETIASKLVKTPARAAEVPGFKGFLERFLGRSAVRLG